MGNPHFYSDINHRLILKNWFFLADLIPHVTEKADPQTREFLQKVVDICLDYVVVQNDRNEKILDFKHPEEMKKLLNLDIPDDPVNLQQLVIDCATTMQYQVKTG